MSWSLTLARIRQLAARSIAAAGHLVKLLFYTIAVVAFIALVLEAGLWRHQETHYGPFAAEPLVAQGATGHAVGFLINGFPRLKCCMEVRSDTEQAPADLQLWINDLESGPAATPPEKIRAGEGSGFSHRGSYVIFSLPPGVENSSATRATIAYSLRPKHGLTALLLLAAALLGGLTYRKRLHALGSRIRSLAADRSPDVARLLFYPVAVFATVALLLQAGMWRNQETHYGPFAPDPFVTANLAGQAVGFLIDGVPRLECCLNIRSDSDQASDLQLWINDFKMGPPAKPHANIRMGQGSGFSHWGRYVLFSLPPGTENSAATHATITYSLRPKSGITPLLFAVAALLGLFKYRERLRSLVGSKAFRSRIGRGIRAPTFALLLLGYALVFACFLYIASIVYAFFAGWALPTTALIRWSRAAEWVAIYEPQVGHLVLALAALGVAAAWIISFQPDAAAGADAVNGHVFRLRRFFSRYGFIIVTSLLVFQMSAMWAGIARPGDLHGSSIAGLLAFSDANGHLAGAHDQARDGVWSAFVSRRPLAAAFRSTLLFFAGYSTPIMLILQAALLSAALCFATAAVARWRGIWSGLTFLALNYIYLRAFAPTALTESLGLFWALISVPFIVRALQSTSLTHAMSAFAFTTVALLTRMGSMFTIPALMGWMAWNFATGTAHRLRVLAIAAAILVGTLLANFTLERLYASTAGGTGSNFSYSLCGLTMGTTWDGCMRRVIEAGGTLPRTEEATARLMETIAWENFKKQPMVLAARLADGAGEFLKQLPDWLWRGYLFEVHEPWWLPRWLLTLLCLIGIGYTLFKRSERGEKTFWALLLGSIVLSAAVVFHDDGRRVLAASVPMICLFLSLGAAGPRPPLESEPAASPGLVLWGQAGLGFALALFVLVPWLAHRLSPIERITGGALATTPGEAIVFGGRRMSGLLVVPDGAERPIDVASVHMSDFEAIIASSRVEDYQGVIHPEAPHLPFALVFAARLEKNVGSTELFIVPPEVLQRTDVEAWRFEAKEWQWTPSSLGYGPVVFYVTRAEPLRLH